MKFKITRGSAAADVVLGAAIIIFVILPVFSVVIEKYIIYNKLLAIKDAVDMTNISAYNAINAENLGRNVVTIDNEKIDSLYRYLLARNLNLNSDLSPHPDSIAEGTVNIDSIIIYTGGFPLTCPGGTEFKRPAVHSTITVPVKPSLYRQIILDMIGREHIELKVHVDSDIPVNN